MVEIHTDDLRLVPIDGETGQTYKGISGSQTYFVKRNATPFLAAVSMDGLTPKLLWSRRTIHGEELIAQEWISARTLRREEMVQLDVLHLIQRVHHSKSLYEKLVTIDGQKMHPGDFISIYEDNLQKDLKTHRFLTDVLNYLKMKADTVKIEQLCVCHGDLNHHNFLLEDTGRLFLVDWDNVKIADPLSDIAAFLCQYVHQKDWIKWLEMYGMTINDDTVNRLEWYVIYYCLESVKKNHFLGQYHTMNESIMLIKQFLKGKM